VYHLGRCVVCGFVGAEGIVVFHPTTTKGVRILAGCKIGGEARKIGSEAEGQAERGKQEAGREAGRERWTSSNWLSSTSGAHFFLAGTLAIFITSFLGGLRGGRVVDI
jgi:hypothetical protein